MSKRKIAVVEAAPPTERQVERPVETHRATIMKKLNAHSVVDIVRYAVRNNLASP